MLRLAGPGDVATLAEWMREFYAEQGYPFDPARHAEAIRGLGARVMQAVEREARALGVQALHLEVERGNEPARALYEKRGLRDTGRQLLSKRLTGA